MLPSRLFRNTGIPPPLRSPITPHPSLPAPISVQLRFRLGVLPGTSISPTTRPGASAGYSTTSSRSNSSFGSGGSSLPKTNAPIAGSSLPSESTPSDSASSSAPATTDSQPLGEPIEPKLQITMTCTVEGCGRRSTHEFTKRAYEKGIVLIECPGCKNRHLIADNLGWFKEGTNDGKLRTIEDLLRSKGEKVKRGSLGAGGVVEYSD